LARCAAKLDHDGRVQVADRIAADVDAQGIRCAASVMAMCGFRLAGFTYWGGSNRSAAIDENREMAVAFVESAMLTALVTRLLGCIGVAPISNVKRKSKSMAGQRLIVKETVKDAKRGKCDEKCVAVELLRCYSSSSDFILGMKTLAQLIPFITEIIASETQIIPQIVHLVTKMAEEFTRALDYMQGSDSRLISPAGPLDALCKLVDSLLANRKCDARDFVGNFTTSQDQGLLQGLRKLEERLVARRQEEVRSRGCYRIAKSESEAQGRVLVTLGCLTAKLSR